ncbi:hypothetical protein HDU93_004085 [Gonapodya sp. JEL0774]|nr:hypothetical protein HDU93_004085 [Gonapodya sp. JEL0774]
MASDPTPEKQADAAEINHLFARLAFLESVVGSAFAPHSALVVPSDSPQWITTLDPRDSTKEQHENEASDNSRTVSVLEKILVVQRFFNQELEQRKTIGDMIRLYSTLRPLLEPDPLTNPSAVSTSSASVADSLPTAVKAEIVLAASEDLERAARWLDEVEVEKDVLSVQIAEVPPTDVSPLELSQLAVADQIDHIRQRTDRIVEGYGELVHSLNELFVFYHATLEDAEREVVEAERRKRKAEQD